VKEVDCCFTQQVNWALRELTAKYGFTPMTTPDIIHPKYAEACGFQPRSEATQIYSIANDELVLVGTQEIPLASLYFDTIIHGDKFPIKLAAFGHCFRAETGTSRSFVATSSCNLISWQVATAPKVKASTECISFRK